MAKQPELGITNPYQLNEAQFDAAIALLEEQRDERRRCTGAPTATRSRSYASGDVVIGTSWQFQVNLLQAESQPIEAVLPDEGSTGWSDTWMIAAEGQAPELHVHVDGPHGVGRGQRPGDGLVRRGPDQPGRRATTPRRISPGHCELTHATDEAYYDKIWYWATPQADCADDDDATTCKDQDDWVDAWTTLRGSLSRAAPYDIGGLPGPTGEPFDHRAVTARSTAPPDDARRSGRRPSPALAGASPTWLHPRRRLQARAAPGRRRSAGWRSPTSARCSSCC